MRAKLKVRESALKPLLQETAFARFDPVALTAFGSLFGQVGDLSGVHSDLALSVR